MFTNKNLVLFIIFCVMKLINLYAVNIFALLGHQTQIPSYILGWSLGSHDACFIWLLISASISHLFN